MDVQSEKARAIFFDAIENYRPEQWPELVQSSCGCNSALQEEVAQLLNVYDSKASFMQSPAARQLDLTLSGPPEDDADLVVGKTIGLYKLLEQIGEGGMGTVFMAVQSQPIKRKVALKIIKPGMDTKQVIARFEAERQALAMMNHPNIAKVLDAGATETGRPYFVMELVRGIPVTEFCDLHKLDLRQRLEMFSTVCQAVQHAHQKGIIHRDLKPSNILVELQDVTPVPKVIDFGVAKPIHQTLTERSLHTGFAQMIGTPLYMSPEQTQLSSLDVDTRSDVYSLGVLLYEMLTGSTPFDKDTLKQAGFDEMRRIIREDEPQKPSERISTLAVAALSTISEQRRVEPRRLSFSLGGELDWIVMKALEKDRSRRYESASAFAQDIRRYLYDEPVLACPPTLAYRLRKLGRRNKVAFAFSSLVVASLLIGVVGLSLANRTLATSRQATQNALKEASHNFTLAETRAAEALTSQQAAETSQQQAEAQRRLAEQHYTQSFDIVQQMLEKITEWNLSEQPGMEQYRVQLLEAANGTLVKLLESRPTDEQVLHLRAQVLLALALDYTSMERLTDALNAYQNAVANADALVAKSVASGPAYRSLQWNTRYGYGFLLHKCGRLNDAIRELRIALPLIENEIQKAPDNKNVLGQLSNVLRALGAFEEQAGNVSHSRSHLRRASELLGIQVSEDLQLSGPISEAHIENLRREGSPSAQGSGLLIALASKQNNPELQIVLWRQAMSIARSNAAQDPVKSVRHQLAFELGSFAGYLHQVGNLEEALQSEREAIAILERLTSEFPTFAVFRSALLRMQTDLGGTLVALNRHDEALTLLNQLAEQNPTDFSVLERRGTLYADHMQDAKKALVDYDRIIELAGDQVTAHHYQLRGNILTVLGDAERARLDLGRAREMEVADLDKRIAAEPDRSDHDFARGLFHEKQGTPLEALADYAKAVELQPENWTYRTQFAGFLYWKYTNDQTLPDPRRGLVHAHIAAQLQPENPRSWSLVAQGYVMVGDTAEEKRNFEKSLEIDPLHTYGLNWLVGEQLRNGELDQAFATAEKLLTVAPEDANNWVVLATVHAAQKQVDKAFEAYNKAISLAPDASCIYSVRGGLHVSLLHDELALSDFSKAIKLQPDAWYLYKRRAACSFRLARFDQTLVDLQKAVELKPDDLSTLMWIPAADIAACPDLKFREGMITLADRCVELNNQSPASLIERAQLLAELGELEKAKQDLQSVVSNEGGPYDQYYEAALLSLKLDDLESYNACCRTMLKTTTAADKPIAKHFTAWTCALAPNAVDDYTDPIALARAAVEAEPTNPQFLNALGAILLRAGRYAEAKPCLEGLVNHAGSEATSKTYTHYFLALSEHHLGNADGAHTQLKTANDLANAVLAGILPWNRRITIELLRKDAEATLSQADK